ncbi:hypothetical protein [Pasteuria penetrans]|nr:hypothetical protein [Pasteuria penetrans]
MIYLLQKLFLGRQDEGARYDGGGTRGHDGKRIGLSLIPSRLLSSKGDQE